MWFKFWNEEHDDAIYIFDEDIYQAKKVLRLFGFAGYHTSYWAKSLREVTQAERGENPFSGKAKIPIEKYMHDHKDKFIVFGEYLYGSA